MGEDISEAYPSWRLFFVGAENHQGRGIGAVLVSESGQYKPMAAKLQFNCTNNMDEYEVVSSVKEQTIHCFHVEAEPDGLPRYFDIKKYLESATDLENVTFNKKKSLRRLALNFFLSGEVLYRSTPDLGLLRCIDAVEAAKLIKTIHPGVCGTHMNGPTLARKILRSG
ncbi:uncharacterized protein LOC107027728 [Solanum pennellii]|uniref:Uncharacterized protein LOC107027728 n=1 Tax=Solanum pennellii TaxID=28526 RepID=A0ABM1HEA9_SOLPN|nr:uncharacterized protein LOC107027728 [Solanum pennellii]